MTKKTMQKTYNILRTAVWCFAGVFIGRSLYQCYDYWRNPLVYEYSSAPWYTSIEVNGIFTAIVIAILLMIMAVLKRKIKNAVTGYKR